MLLSSSVIMPCWFNDHLFLILGPGIAMSGGAEPWHVREHDRGGDPWRRREDRDRNGRRGSRSNYSAVHDPTNRILPD